MAELEKLAWYVMDAMADDWESVEQIRPHVHECCEPVSDEQILEILRQLHGIGLIEMMDEEGNPTRTLAPNRWFRMTTAGRAIWENEGFKYRGD